VKASLKFGYTMRVTTAGGDKVSRDYVENYEFEVPEFAGDQAPVRVMVVPGGPRHELGQPASVRYAEAVGGGDAFRPVVREVGGQAYMLMERDTYRNDGWVACPVRADALAETENMFRDLGAVRKGAEVKRKGPPRPSTVDYGDRDYALQAVKKVADSLLVVDGEVYSACPEPVYIAQAGRVVVSFRKPDYEDLADVFRLDELDKAVERASLLGDVAPADVMVPSVRVPDPAFLKADPDGEALLAEAGKIETRAAGLLPELPLDAMSAYCDLRESRERRVGDGMLRDALVSMCAELEKAGHGFGLAGTRDVVRVSDRRREKEMDLSAEALPSFS
jgi:hypothetical protein